LNLRQKRAAADDLVAQGLTERQSCSILQLHRSARRYVSKRQPDAELIGKIKSIAAERPRFGYLRIHAMLKGQGVHVNHKRVYRIYREENLAVRKRGRRKYFWGRRAPKEVPSAPNVRWSMDFTSDMLHTGQRFRTLNIIDDCTRECLAIEVSTSIPGKRVIEILEQLRWSRGLPKEIVVDNGPEFTCKAMIIWACNKGVNLHFITPGKPIQNAMVESFNGRFRDECLNQYWFTNMNDARKLIADWRDDYNNVRPHSALNNRTPSQFRQHQEELIKQNQGQHPPDQGILAAVS
jgi:putative transposase